MRELVQGANIKATSYKLVNARKALMLNEHRDCVEKQLVNNKLIIIEPLRLIGVHRRQREAINQHTFKKSFDGSYMLRFRVVAREHVHYMNKLISIRKKGID